MSAPALRDEILGGRLARPGCGGLALQGFLRHDRGALAGWFGAEAEALRTDAARLRCRVDGDVAAIDGLIAAQLDAVLHHPRLQRLEGSWRGLAWLVEGVEPGTRLRIRLLSAGWEEIERDLARVVEFDQSALFRHLYENEFGTPGGEPFGLLVVDHELRHVPRPRGAGRSAPVDDVSVLGHLADIAAAAFLPMVLAADPVLLGVDRFEDLALAHDAAAALGDGEHARWRALAARENARFLCVTMPRVLARPRWRSELLAVSGLRYEEHAPAGRHRCWSVAGYAFAATVVRAQAAFNWPADIRGIATDRVGGALVQDLPGEPVVLGAGTRWDRPPLDLALTDRQERALVLAGLMPLNTLPYGDAGFAAVHSMQSRETQSREAGRREMQFREAGAREAGAAWREPSPAAANARIATQVNSMLCASRFAHFIKIIARNLTGASLTAEAIERRLQAWLAGYVNASQSADADSRAKYPLVSGRVGVHALPDRPGSFGCVVHLQPYHQLDDVAATFRLVTEFSATGSRA